MSYVRSVGKDGMFELARDVCVCVQRQQAIAGSRAAVRKLRNLRADDGTDEVGDDDDEADQADFEVNASTEEMSRQRQRLACRVGVRMQSHA